ncbi:MAG TPA: ABC transporter ATP-binding protein [Candidatus Binatia bacterium]|nr:ABC transporter ATP-binding protein [Candidatus Binatia bacterium]
MIEPILQVRRLAKTFGGLAAVAEVSLDVNVGELHAVIGPNGAGKTTLINMLSGDLSPSAGSICFGGDEVAHLSPERRSRLGIGRSYQKVNIFAAFSALENCRLAAQARDPRPLNWLREASSYDVIVAAARSALADVGLANRAETVAFTLSHGEQRQLEIAMSLATQPKLLLLDEPLAGLGIEESSRMVELIRRMAQTHAILLVEHDMDAIFQLARVLTVMVDGRVLASGKPDEVRADEQVQRAYLGKSDEHP